MEPQSFEERRLDPSELNLLRARALRVREHVVQMGGRGGCFVGGALSCVEILVHLYSRVLRVSPETLADPGRDYLFLSKGHDVPALYGTLAELGFFPQERLEQHLAAQDSVYLHPNRDVPGVEFHSGSLGHLLSVAAGVAMDIRRVGGKNRVFVVLGDGELDEGSVWEAALVAAAHRLDNLVAVVDRNGLQANIETEALIPLEPLADKFTAFGWEVRSADGHRFEDLDRAFASLPMAEGRPGVVLARTVRGKGIPSIEARPDRWFCRFGDHEVAAALAELHRNIGAP
jgi:transketolase